MAKTKSYTDRVKVINRCLHNSKRLYKIDELITRIFYDIGENVSEKTVRNDISAMRAENAPIKNKPGAGYYYDPPSYNFFELPIIPAHIDNIRLAASLVKQIPGLDLHEELANIIKDLQLMVEEDEPQYIQFDNRPHYEGSKYMVDVLEAIRGNTVITFDYQPFKYDSPRPVTIHPYLLKEFNNRWFLIGLCEETRQQGKYVFKQCGLERIKGSIKVENKISFYRHHQFDPVKMYENVFGMFIPIGVPVQRVVLKFSPLRAKYVATNPLHSTQSKVKNSENTFAFQLIPNPELEGLILSYGADVEVLEPKELRERVSGILMKTAEKYKTECK